MVKEVLFQFKNFTSGTPGAARFAEIDENGKELKSDEDGQVVGGMYIRRAQMNGETPQRIRVTIETVS